MSEIFEQAKGKIIVALDVDTPQRALDLVLQLKPHVGLFKIGLELIYTMLASVIPAKDAELRDTMVIHELFGALDGRIFWDGKLYDIPNTVAGAARAITSLNVRMFNVHASGSSEMMKQALEAARLETNRLNLNLPPLALAVTVLTSMHYDDLVDTGVCRRQTFSDEQDEQYQRRAHMEEQVLRLARLARESGMDGIVCSPLEIRRIREACGTGFWIVTPGVRPPWASLNDQARVLTPGGAIESGADYVVIGRPITAPPVAIGGPVDAANHIAAEIAHVLQKNGRMQ